MIESLNFGAVLVSTIVSIVLGMFWYSPAGFGKQWMKLVGMDKKKMEAAKKKGMGTSYFFMLVSALLLTIVLSLIVTWSGAVGFSNGLITGFWVWLGFGATLLLDPVLWEGKAWHLYYINASYRLVTFLVMGGILGAWQ